MDLIIYIQRLCVKVVFDLCYIYQMKEKYLTSEDITSSMRISKERLSLMIKQGLFPKPILLHTGAQLWSEIVVKDWMNMRFKTEDWITKDINSELF